MRSTADERMDTDCVDYDDYRRCLRDLARVNTVTMTHRPMLAWLARETAGLPSFSLLDVACGHGDALRRIHRWADATRDRSAARWHGSQSMGDAGGTRGDGPTARSPIATATCSRSTRRRNFDFIISSQFTHHLTDEQIVLFITWMEAHARRGWFIGDLHRHWLPYYGFGVLAWLARWHHFVLSDGRISIARAFVPEEWRRLIAARPALRSVTSPSPGICRSGSVSRGIVRPGDHRRRASRDRRRHHACPRGTGRDADRARCRCQRQGVRRFSQRRGACDDRGSGYRSVRGVHDLCGAAGASESQRYHASAVRRARTVAPRAG